MSVRSPATTVLDLLFPPTVRLPQGEQHLPLSPPHSPEDLNGLPLRDRYKTHDHIYQHTSPTGSSVPPLAPSFQTSADPYSSAHLLIPPAPSTPDTIRVKSEICSPPLSQRPSPSPADCAAQTLGRPSTPTRDSPPVPEDIQQELAQVGSSPTTRALRSLGLTRADLAQHAQRMKSFLVAGGRRGFPSAAELANTDVKSETADSDLPLTQSSTSSIRRQTSVVSHTSSVYTTATTTDTSRASSTHPNGPSTNTSVATTSSNERRAPARGRPALPPLPPSSPPEMFSPVGGSGESNRTGINSSPIRSPLASPARAGPSRTYATNEYATNDVPYTLPPGPRTTEKPSASYAALIGQAITSAIPDSNGKKKLTLAQIYAWISAAWPFYKPGEAGWMNSIRHNLSLNDCFIKIKRDGREKGKGSFWRHVAVISFYIREGDEDMFANGGFVRRNSAAKKRKKDMTPTRDEPEPRQADPPKRTKTNQLSGPSSSYVYEPPQYPPPPGVPRAAHQPAPVAQPAAKRSRAAAPAQAPVNQKSYRSPVLDQIPSSSPPRLDSGKRAHAHDYEGLPPELTPNMSSSPDMPDSSPISSSPPPPVARPAAREAPADYPRKSGLMDMIINNSSKKRRVSGGASSHVRVSTLDNGSPVMKRRANADAEEPATIYPASMLARPSSPTRHINPRVTLKARTEPAENKASHSARTDASSSRQPNPITPPSHGSAQSGLPSSSDRPAPLVVKPSDIIPSTPPRTLTPLTMATSAERTPLSHAALHMSPSRPSDLSHFKNSVHPPSASYRDSPGHPMEFRTPLGRETRRVTSLSGSILGMSGESPMLRTPLGYGGIRDINDLNSGCAEELMARDQLIWDLAQKQVSQTSTGAEHILLRRLTQKLPPRLDLAPTSNQPSIAEPLPSVVETQPAPPGVLEELSAIKSTPFDQSFASRLYGQHTSPPTVFFQDWETMSPWMELMADVMGHYRLSHPSDSDNPSYTWAPVTYTPIYAFYLPQVHDLLERTFWPGIDVSDSVKWEPEQCSIVATYKKLVVGCAFLSETMDPYVTYIAVRAGWEGAGIATFMLYHLIKQNPNQDISLHVSATNPAMLLYNRFGFKAEEFVVGFYDDYLGKQTKLCKNALRLRYRR
ncbi:hypothetical protein FRC07_003446 [Ceratobasidium sp. 392]|nr:hypothetical protein FRC07_003446 [Ceratobasidium sp. 392]